MDAPWNVEGRALTPAVVAWHVHDPFATLPVLSGEPDPLLQEALDA